MRLCDPKQKFSGSSVPNPKPLYGQNKKTTNPEKQHIRNHDSKNGTVYLARKMNAYQLRDFRHLKEKKKNVYVEACVPNGTQHRIYIPD